MSNDLGNRIRVFTKWCKNHKDDNYDYEREGSVERLIRESREKTIIEIGEMLDEILEMDSQQIDTEMYK